MGIYLGRKPSCHCSSNMGRNQGLQYVQGQEAPRLLQQQSGPPASTLTPPVGASIVLQHILSPHPCA